LGVADHATTSAGDRRQQDETDEARRATSRRRRSRTPGARLGTVALVALALLAVVPRLLLVWAIPLGSGSADPNCAPDELEHFLFVRELAAGRTPTWPEAPTIYAAFLPTVYVVHALALAAGGPVAAQPVWYRFAPSRSELLGFPFARLGGVILGLITVWALAAAAHGWTGSRSAALCAGAVAALYPQLVFVGAYVNADAFTIAAGVLLVAALERWQHRRGDVAPLTRLAVTMALVIAGKPSGYFVLLPTACVLIAAWRRDEVGTVAATASIATLALLAGPLLLWNALRNQGDVLGVGKFSGWLAQWHRADARGISGAAPRFVETLTESSFARFRNMDLALPSGFYVIFFAMLAIGLLHGARSVLRSREPRTRTFARWLLGCIVGNVALVAYDTWFVEFQAQGRWILVCMLLLTVVAVLAPTGGPLPPSIAAGWVCACLTFLAVSLTYSVAMIASHPCLR
jgi:hypothetical protein